MEKSTISKLMLVGFFICIALATIPLWKIATNIEYAKNDPCGACEDISGKVCKHPEDKVGIKIGNEIKAFDANIDLSDIDVVPDNIK